MTVTVGLSYKKEDARLSFPVDDRISIRERAVAVVDKEITDETDSSGGIGCLHLYDPEPEHGEDMVGMGDGFFFLTDDTTVEERGAATLPLQIEGDGPVAKQQRGNRVIPVVEEKAKEQAATGIREAPDGMSDFPFGAPPMQSCVHIIRWMDAER